jgi:ABC-2 type transport system permease protein
VITTPSLLLPSLMFPLFFFVAFAGGLSQVQNTPGFDYPNGYTAFQFVFVLLQSAAFGGVFTGFGVARDFEGGFARRLMLAAPAEPGSSWLQHGCCPAVGITTLLTPSRSRSRWSGVPST